MVKLYERCLIACANYPEYWIRYVSCMETSGSLDLADNALARATQVFVKVKCHEFFLKKIPLVTICAPMWSVQHEILFAFRGVSSEYTKSPFVFLTNYLALCLSLFFFFG